MSAEAALNLEELQGEENCQKEIFEEQIKMQKIEEFALRIIQNNEIAKERREESNMLKEDLETLLEEGSYEPLVFELSDGEFAVVQRKYSSSDKLDKDALAETLGIEKEELKTPYDISALTEKEILTPKLIQEHTHKEEKEAITVKRVKKDPRKKERKKR